MKVAIIGGVQSTQTTLEALVRHRFDIELVMGYEPQDRSLVSGFADLKAQSHALGLPYLGFRKINEHAQAIAALEIDLLFVVGLSQLVNETITQTPRLGAIGFHPTDLPQGRGRAPLAWLVHEARNGAACFFLLESRADAGPLFVKEPFEVHSEDDAARVETKILAAMERALDTWLPQLKRGVWDPRPQDERLATEYGARRPEDGLLEFASSAQALDRLVKAAAPPHPGAFTFFRHQKVRALASRLEQELKIRGCCGRVLKIQEDWHLIQTGEGLLWLKLELDTPLRAQLRVGQRLGYQCQLEIQRLHEEIELLRQELKRIAL